VFFYDLKVEGKPEPIRFETYKTVDDLVWMVQNYLGLNNLPMIEGLKQKIVDFMCANLPPGFCVTDSTGPKRSITMSQVKDITKVMWKKVTTAGVGFLAPKVEAERRAEICSRCPLNDHSRCGVCGGLLALMTLFWGRVVCVLVY
jgi:hypothetical protein